MEVLIFAAEPHNLTENWSARVPTDHRLHVDRRLQGIGFRAFMVVRFS